MKAQGQHSSDRARAVDDGEADEIKKKIGPGLRSMYANVLSEDLPEDLLAVVRAMASKEDASKAEKAASSTGSDQEGGNADE
jgi:hypothetical protein